MNISDRQYKIIECLEGSSDSMALRQIGEAVGCSYKTVQNEITKLRQILPKGWSIRTTKGIGASLIQPSNETVESAFSHDDHSVFFDLIEQLLLDKAYSLEELCEQLYLSRKATLKLISSVEAFIQPLFLQMQRRPYQIAGSEGAKRLLLFEINLSRNGILNHYVKHPKYKQMEKARDMLEHDYGIRLTDYGFNVLSYFYRLCIRRAEKGFLADELPYGVSRNVQQEPLFIGMQDFFDYLETLLVIQLPLHERVYFYLCLIYTEFQFTIIHQEDRHALLQAHKDYDQFMAFIRYLETNLRISIEHDDDLLFNIFNLYQVSQLRRVAPKLQYLPKASVLRSVKDNAPQTHSRLESLCHEWSKKTGFNFHQSNIISLVVHLNRHINQSDALKANILLLTSRSFFLTDFDGRLKTHFEGVATFKNMNASQVSNEEDIPPGTDIIITDSLVLPETPDIETILITDVMTDKDIAAIAQTIERIKQSKKDTFLSEAPIWLNP
ncbi:helix-turn-helix domain-containing protein [Lentibacillus salicampi]|uniref:HTH domain-containing protein n=1 Tax=Lentibacillus salicampi TaxID=175306 RepID=A0A4Y9AFC4_9BACI|nr:helix-turn-helix domain-containing protein [Lentibacillus salicampi]TFJ93064.1 hypothetical protein E4U82_08940 [Lentibacillus salicampi]